MLCNANEEDQMTKEDLARRKAAAEQQRVENLAKARRDWRSLADKDEWPEEEHEARFEAILRCSLFQKVIK